MTKYSIESCLPILTFVGRPLDPNKGLVTLMDALELLHSLPCSPHFIVWIIGGDDDELPHLHSLIAARPRLMHEVTEGRFIIWGKVKRDALPEFYRRSSLVVMPSIREPFGLVAIEAMACGTPVIGTRQGGLDDTILSGLTGAKVEVDQPDSLAGAILLYLRGPSLCKTRGQLARRWASVAFSKKNAYGKMSELYTSKAIPDLVTVKWDLVSQFHEEEIISRLSSVENLIGRAITSWQVVAARHHIVAKIQTVDGVFALKVFRDRPSLTAAMFSVGQGFPARTAQDFVDNAIYHTGNPCIPPLIATDRKSGLAIHAWIDMAPFQSSSVHLRAVARDFTEHGKRVGICEPQLESYLSALNVFLVHRDEICLGKLDCASAELNRACQHVNFGIRTSHPVAELTRIVLCLDKKGWPIPADVSDRIRMVVNMLLAKWIPLDELPKLQHGDLKARHLMSASSGLLVIDTEHSLFAIGELDLGTYAAGEVMSGVSMFNVVREIDKTTESKAATISALQWMAYYLVHGYLSRVHHGKTTKPTKVIRHALFNLALAIT